VERLDAPSLVRPHGGWGGQGGGSRGRRETQRGAAGEEMRRGPPRGGGDGDGARREEGEPERGRHSHGWQLLLLLLQWRMTVTEGWGLVGGFAEAFPR